MPAAVEQVSGRPGGEAAVGRVLLALHRRDAAAVARAATATRDAPCTPLAAAAMEGSYRHAHPAVVQLHLIRERRRRWRRCSRWTPNVSVSGLLENVGKQAIARRRRSAFFKNPVLRPVSAQQRPWTRGRRRLSDWDDRLALTPSAMATREPILALRRAAYAALGASAEDASA